MKDPRFLPIEKREPMDDFDDEFAEEYDDETDDLLQPKGKKPFGKDMLYVAS